MGFYRKKPIVIEAMQFTKETCDQVFNWVTCNKYACENEYDEPEMVIQTLEGDMTVSLDDYVIKGVMGEFYPCKANIFEETYEDISDETYDDFSKEDYNKTTKPHRG